MDPGIENFLESLSLLRGASDGTVNGYRRDLSKLEAYCERNGLNLLTLSAADARGFLMSTEVRSLSPVSVNRLLSAVKGCYRFWEENGTVQNNPCRRLKGVIGFGKKTERSKTTRLPELKTSKPNGNCRVFSLKMR